MIVFDAKDIDFGSWWFIGGFGLLTVLLVACILLVFAARPTPPDTCPDTRDGYALTGTVRSASGALEQCVYGEESRDE